MQAVHRGDMPTRGAGYLKLASWAVDELRGLDSGALQDARFGAHGALQVIIESFLDKRPESESRVSSLARLSAEAAARALLLRLRTP